MADSLTLELADFEHLVHTGIYSEETGRPQPLRFSVSVKLAAVERYVRPGMLLGLGSVSVKLAAIERYEAETSLDASKNYMDLKFACSEALGDTHFKLIEAIADHVCETLFLQDKRVEAVTVKIVKLALSERDEKIGITLHRERR